MDINTNNNNNSNNNNNKSNIKKMKSYLIDVEINDMKVK